MKVRSIVFSLFSSFLLLLLTLGLFSVRSARAQTQVPPIGNWGVGFNHTTNPSLGGTDPLVPFAGGAGSGYIPPGTIGVGSWGFYDAGGGVFQPIHMALIPKGPDRGKILVWDEYPVVLHPRASLDNQWWVCQSWSIVDPDSSAVPRFRNFLLPLQTPGPILPTPAPVASIVCSGHAWSQNGDLVVAGGTTADVPLGSMTPVLDSSNARSANFLFMFDPVRPSQPFPGPNGPPLYPNGEIGHWEKAPNQLLMDLGRYYPTVTLSQKLTRASVNGEVVAVWGGSDISLPPTPPQLHDPINTYESFIVQASSSSNFLTRDPDHLVVNNAPQFWLPGLPTTGELLDEYPRFHVLNDGQAFLSGYLPLSSKIDLNLPFTMTGQRPWDSTTVGRNQTPWNDKRENGASVFFARMGALQDIVIRLGGTGATSETDTAEFWCAGVSNDWVSLANIVPGGARTGLNAVVLPDASVLVIGGDRRGNPRTPVLETALYVQGQGWKNSPPPPASPEQRNYHSTAVLLPDGRVFVGGGNNRVQSQFHWDWDYNIYTPQYMMQVDPNSPPPLRPTILLPITNAPPDPLDPTTPVLDSSTPITFEFQYGSTTGLNPVTKIVLMAPGSITHHCDMTARYVELPSAAGSGPLTQPPTRLFQLPYSSVTGRCTLPRGYYMLFAVNLGGIPSVAQWVKIT